MTLTEKDLLLQDICARLPYGLKFKKLTKADSDIADIGATVKLYSINLESYCDIRFYTYEGKALTVCEEGRLFRPGYFLRYKPYLFPMSSMTEEHKRELSNICKCLISFTDWEICFPNYEDNNIGNWQKVVSWMYKNHYDINGLIPSGLAIDATGLNIY